MDKEVCEKAIIAFNEMNIKSKTLDAMKESQKIVESGKSRFESVEEMFENLGI